jgi:phasin family protein
MSTLPEQLSAASKSQLEAQLNFFKQFSAKAVAGAEQLIALNIATSKNAVDRSATVWRQMLAVQDPRDLLALTGQSQQQFEGMLAYGRALAGIANAMQADVGQAALPVTISRAAPAEPIAVKPVRKSRAES